MPVLILKLSETVPLNSTCDVVLQWVWWIRVWVFWSSTYSCRISIRVGLLIESYTFLKSTKMTMYFLPANLTCHNIDFMLRICSVQYHLFQNLPWYSPNWGSSGIWLWSIRPWTISFKWMVSSRSPIIVYINQVILLV